MSFFQVDMDGAWTLDVGAVWPDGDGPENPTAEDVIAVMEEYGVRGLISDWNLTPTVTVNGHDADLS